MSASNNTRILAIDPASRGFGYALLEGGAELIDWGVAGAHNGDVASRFAALVRRYTPEMVVLPDIVAGESRHTHARATASLLKRLCDKSNLRCRLIARKRVRSVFETKRTKHDIASEIAHAFPELASRLPGPRRPWMSEDYRTSIFDAAALALAATMNLRIGVSDELRTK